LFVKKCCGVARSGQTTYGPLRNPSARVLTDLTRVREQPLVGSWAADNFYPTWPGSSPDYRWTIGISFCRSYKPGKK